MYTMNLGNSSKLQGASAEVSREKTRNVVDLSRQVNRNEL